MSHAPPSSDGPVPPGPAVRTAPQGWEEAQQSPEFQALKRSFRRVIFPTTAAFLLWYASYVLLAAFAPGFMGTQVVGNINIGLLFGLSQFVTTFAITMAYRRWADRTLDPQTTAVREHLERTGGDRRAPGTHR